MLEKMKLLQQATNYTLHFYTHPDSPDNSNSIGQTPYLQEINSSQSETTLQETLTTVANVTENAVLNQEDVIVQNLTIIENESDNSNNMIFSQILEMV